ncbi:response regulator [Longimicrobium terrae]|jgi:two-component system cell cycle response regulator DivK|uniref:CheY-like chemotaxis protein n=1 Tax=Longimicrobium terrae TaxID=1639882 RepID=A0A841H6I2_9BACT|nr:response regulator [Longimicrobium terrae]MBB4639070.1 CheY-like chemotaxis protein [Longimicrobium terrae]MBB6073329.1 CheY-like chemotaxis protein [Longimicrobium terrae]NNC28768.1 response regulator [Longimicrobium terrae]
MRTAMGGVSPRTVLIVEDQLEMRAITTAYLEHQGYRVVSAGDGVEGLRCAREVHPDLILMDISIPGLDGIEATAALKRDPATRDIPIIIVSAHPYGSVGKRARDAGCDGWLNKPCDPRRVLEEVERRVGAPN